MKQNRVHKQAAINFKDNAFYLSGDLTFNNVMQVYASSLPQLKKNPKLEFNFSELKSSDSSGLALIIEWIKYARENNKTISLKYVPESLLSIAKAANLDSMLMELNTKS